MLPPPPHNIILFELDFNVKFPLLRLLQFLSDLKSTINMKRNELFSMYSKNSSNLNKKNKNLRKCNKNYEKR